MQLFKVDSIPSGRKYSHLVVNIPKRTVKLPLGSNGKMQSFSGRVEFTSVYQDKDLVGRWAWNSSKKKKKSASVAKAKGKITETAVEGAAADLSPEETETSKPSAVEESYEDKVFREAAADAAAAKAAAEARKQNDEKKSGGIHWVPIAISAAVAVGGGVMAAVYNNKAKDERDREPKNVQEYNEISDNISSAQKLRSVGIGIALVGLVGVGVSFMF